jgi:hypothetical protein
MANYVSKASFIDNYRNLAVVPEIGEALADQSRFIAALGLPREVTAGDLKVNWTQGGTAALPSTSTWAGNASPAALSGSHTYSMGMIFGMGAVDDYSRAVAAADPVAVSVMMASYDVDQKFASELINGTGTDFSLAGFDYYLNTVNGDSAYRINASGTTGFQAVTTLQASLDKAQVVLNGNANLIVTSKEGFRALKGQLRSAGGVTPVHEGLRNFGFGDTLSWDGIPVIYTDYVTSDTTNKLTSFYMLNVNHYKGVDFVVPTNRQAVTLKGPISVAGSAYDNYHLEFFCQILYRAPNCLSKLYNMKYE